MITTKRRPFAREAGRSTRTKSRRRVINPKVLIGASLLLVGTVGVAFSLAKATQGSTTVVVITTHRISQGSILTASDLATIAVHLPSELTAAASTSHPLSLIGRQTVTSLLAGAIVTTSVLAPEVPTTPQRVLSISGVDPQSLLSSNISVGSRVDVAVTYGSGASATTEAVATQLRVVGITGTASSLGGAQGDQVSVEVNSLLEGLAVAQAENAGKITLINATGAPPAKGLEVYPPYTPSSSNSTLP